MCGVQDDVYLNFLVTDFQWDRTCMSFGYDLVPNVRYALTHLLVHFVTFLHFTFLHVVTRYKRVLSFYRKITNPAGWYQQLTYLLTYSTYLPKPAAAVAGVFAAHP